MSIIKYILNIDNKTRLISNILILETCFIDTIQDFSTVFIM